MSAQGPPRLPGRVVPRAARQAARVLTVSERTRRDLARALRRSRDEKIVVTPNGVDPAFTPGNTSGPATTSSPSARSSRGRTSSRRSLRREAAGLPLVVAGPAKDEALARRAASGAARGSRATSTQDELVELYRGAACLVQASRYEGFGLPVLEAMACGTPVVAVPSPRCSRSPGDAAVVGPRSGARGRDPARGRRARPARRGRARAGARSSPGVRPRGATLDVYRESRVDAVETVSAVVVSHGHARELERSLPALLPQVDELVVIANVPGSRRRASRRAPACSRTHARPRFAANVNRGVAETSGELVVSRTRTPSRSRAPSPSWPRFADDASALRASSARSCSGPTGPGSRASAASRPSPGRSGAARRCACSATRTSTRSRTTADAPDEPVQGDWLLGGACLLMRRSMLEELGGWDAGFRHYVEDIDLGYRAAQAGWERWFVPAAVVHHDYAAVIDKRFLTGTRSGTRAGWCASCASTPSRCGSCASRRRPKNAKATWAPRRARVARVSGRARAGTNGGVDRHLDVVRRLRRRDIEDAFGAPSSTPSRAPASPSGSPGACRPTASSPTRIGTRPGVSTSPQKPLRETVTKTVPAAIRRSVANVRDVAVTLFGSRLCTPIHPSEKTPVRR